jgi:hypothetical protein
MGYGLSEWPVRSAPAERNHLPSGAPRTTGLTGGLVADEVVITDIRAGLLPADKVATINSLEANGARVLLVGDGINDAPPRPPPTWA